MIIAKITGIPNNAAIVFIGIILPDPGSCERVSAISIIPPPRIAEAGISTLWSASLYVILAMCGTAMPINPIGPQKAVMPPARSVVATIILIFTLFVFIPAAWI